MRGVLSVVFILIVLSLAACAPDGSSAYVSYNIPPDGNCEVSPGSDKFLPTGSYDLKGKTAKKGVSKPCNSPYYVNLLVNSSLRMNANAGLGRVEPNVLQLHNAQVRLMDSSGSPLRFSNGALPNPFTVTTNNSLRPSMGTSPSTGIAVVEVIPIAYAALLLELAGDQILAEIQIFGTTIGDEDIDFKPFIYPIQLCNGCLTMCIGDLGTLKPADVYGKACADNAGADGRTCIDPTC